MYKDHAQEGMFEQLKKKIKTRWEGLTGNAFYNSTREEFFDLRRKSSISHGEAERRIRALESEMRKPHAA